MEFLAVRAPRARIRQLSGLLAGRAPRRSPSDRARGFMCVLRSVAPLQRAPRLQIDVSVVPVLVKHIMSSPVVTFFAEQTLPLAEDVMRFKHLRHLPVVDERGRLIGLVTHRDLLRAQISSLSGLTPEERRARQMDICVSEIMTRDVWTVTANTLASVAGTTMLDHRYGCLPVVDLARTLVGIVTERDYLRCAMHALRMNDPEEHVRAVTQSSRVVGWAA